MRLAIALFAAVGASFLSVSIASAASEPFRASNPITLDSTLIRGATKTANRPAYPAMRSADIAAINAAFKRYQVLAGRSRAAQVTYLRALSRQPLTSAKGQPVPRGVPMVFDPQTEMFVNANAVVAESIILQKAWYTATGRNLRPDEPFDLNIIAKSPAGIGRYVAPAAVPPQRAITLTGPSSGGCPVPTNPDDLAAAWSATKTFHDSPDDSKICTLPYGGLIQQVDATGTSVIPSTGSGFTRSFGDAKSAQGTFSFKPTINAPGKNGDVLDASLELSFIVAFLSGQVPSLTLLGGTAGIKVPQNNGPVTSTVSISGVAFPDNSRFTSTQATNGCFQYSGSPAKSFTFFDYSHEYSVPFLLGTTSITAHAWVDGDTSLTYDLEGGADGLFATATPKVQAGAHAQVAASVLKVTGVAVTANVTVQNNNSSFAGLATLIPFDNAIFGVERLRANYAPSDYQATVILTGWFPLVLHGWKITIMDTGDKPISVGSFLDDSNWSVQKLMAIPPSGDRNEATNVSNHQRVAPEACKE